jgi:hypothetical protein
LVPPFQRTKRDFVGVVLEVLRIVEGTRMPLPLGNCGRRVIKMTGVMIDMVPMLLAIGLGKGDGADVGHAADHFSARRPCLVAGKAEGRLRSN